MKKQLMALLAGALATASVQAVETYPKSQSIEHVDEYFGVEVSDPYRWMEEMSSEEVKAWVKAQNKHALPRLKDLPGWQKINDRLTELWRYERYGVPYKKGDSYYYDYNNGDWDQNIFYRTGDLAQEGKPMLDPRSLSEDGTIAAKRLKVSPKGRYLAYGISDGGTDWTDYRIRNLKTGKDLEEQLTGIKFSDASWAPDESGFYYSRYPFNKNGGADDSKQVAVYFHRLGAPRSATNWYTALPTIPPATPMPR